MKIRGNVTATPMKRSDFNETNPKSSAFILNNPIPKVTAEDNGKFLRVEGGKWAAVEIPYAEGEEY